MASATPERAPSNTTMPDTQRSKTKHRPATPVKGELYSQCTKTIIYEKLVNYQFALLLTLREKMFLSGMMTSQVKTLQ